MYSSSDVVILLCSLLMFFVFPLPSSYGETFNTSAELLDDAMIDEDVPDDSYGDTELLGLGWSNSADDEVKKAVIYLKFDISDLPQNNLFSDVNLDSAELELFLQTIWTGDDHDWFLVSLDSCMDHQWSESTITWNNRTCDDPASTITQDSLLINKSDVPGFFSWNVINSVKSAQDNDLSNITLILSSFPLDIDHVTDLDEDEYRELEASVIWTWPSEKNNVGINAKPSLNIIYTVTNSFLSNLIMIIVSVFGTIFGGLSLYKHIFSRDKNSN